MAIVKGNNHSVSTGELLLREILLFNIDNDNIFYNYRKLGIKNPKTNAELEIDIYYPDYKLAFEFQGEEHYNVTDFATQEDVEETKRRDKIKEEFCKNNGILLVAVNAINLSSATGRKLPYLIPDLKLFPCDWKNEKYISKVKLLQWKCKEYRKKLNKKYKGHTSAKSEVRLWRESLKEKGIDIPNVLKRRTKIPQEIRDIVESGKYEEWCNEVLNNILKIINTKKYPPRDLRLLSLYIPDEMREKTIVTF